MPDGIRVSDLWFGYPRSGPVLRGVTLDVPPGSLAALIGPNGCGKSTLLRVLAGYERRERGTVLVMGEDPAAQGARQRAALTGYLPQHDPWDVPFSVREMVAMGRFAVQGSSPFESEADVAAADQALAQAGASAVANRIPHELSGGERQRAQLARALVNDPAVLLLDEPAANLDPRCQVETYGLIRRLCHERGRTALIVSHDFNLPCLYADLVIVMRDGAVTAAGGPARVLDPELLESVYGTPFDSALTPDGRRLIAPRGVRAR